MIFSAVQFLTVVIACAAAGLHAMHVLQAERYQIDALRRQLHRGEEAPILHEIPVAVIVVLIGWYLPVPMSMAIQLESVRTAACSWAVLGVFVLGVVLICLRRRSVAPEKPFKITHRMCRLIALDLLVNLAGVALLRLLSIPPYVMFAFASYVALLCALILQPLEMGINARYYAAARKKIAARKDLICIGITGSYGKTEVKQMLKTILSEKFNVLATPPSFSTAMGISRVANEQLDESHEIFIAEMGAQHRGEIRDMAKLMRPKYGILTCVSGEHLDSFGSIEAVAQAKSELLEALPEDGAAFFGADRSYGDRLYALHRGEKYRAGIGTEADHWMRAEHVETSVKGTRFELVCKDGTHAWMQTQLLGRYAVRNLALCAAVAKKLGMRMEDIVRGVEKVRPFRHHLQLIPGEINVIDDSENLNLEAALEALRVLGEFPGRRVLVTGGFSADPDAQTEHEDYDFGMRIAGSADYVILVGAESAKSVVSGLMSKRFPKSSVRIVESMDDAAAFVREIAGKGDTVLYEGVEMPEEE